jgi:hypothetical protein
MTDMNLIFDHVAALIFKIHIITGWEVPASTAFLNTLQDQLRKKLLEEHRDMNPDEIEYAFRNFGSRVNNWGKAMNLALVDEVLNHYKVYRSEVSHLESLKRSQPVKELEGPPINFGEYAETVYNSFKNGLIKDWRLIPHSLYEHYTGLGIIQATKPEKLEAMEAAKAAIKQMKAEDPGFAQSIQTDEAFKDYQVRFAQKMIVAKYFKEKIKHETDIHNADIIGKSDGLEVHQAG